MKSARILIVDDDDHVREALVDELSPIYRVEAVGSGGEAFDALSMNQYDVVISDLKMPDHDGIEVLDFARRHQGDAVRVLLTGYLDENAQRALMTPDAPYKVGKPWHDEIEVVVRRGLEQRELARRLCASVDDALSLTTFDSELGAARTPIEVAQLVVRRALAVDGVKSCGVVVIVNHTEHLFAGGPVPGEGQGWYLDLPLDRDGDLRVRARGVGDSPRQLIQYMTHRVQRASGVLQAPASPLPDLLGPGARTNQLLRQATVGALTAALLHDLASGMQSLSASLADVATFAEGGGPELQAALDESTATGNEVVELFVQMRRFIRDGEVQIKPVPLARLVERALRLAGGHVRQRAELQVAPMPDVDVSVCETLFLQVLINLLRNALAAVGKGGTVRVTVDADGNQARIRVWDSAGSIPSEDLTRIFEPFYTTSAAGTGLGLSTVHAIVQAHAGAVAVTSAPSLGTTFTVALPRKSAAEA